MSTQAAKRSEEIASAARSVILRQGLTSLRVADVAAEAQLSSAAVHYHFDSKADVLAAAFRYSAERMFSRLDDDLAMAIDDADRLRILVASCIPDDGEVGDEYRLWIQLWAAVNAEPGLLPLCEEVSTRWHTLFRDTVSAGAASGQLTLRCAPRDAADRLTALLDGLGFETAVGYRHASTARMRHLVAGYLADEFGLTLGES